MQEEQIKLHPVVSSNIEAAGYDKVTETMEVKFKNGSRYQYSGVGEGIYRGMFEAESPGNFFRKMIVKGGYKFKKL